MKVLAIDTETTSKDATKSIVELGIVTYDTITNEREIFVRRYKPRERISFGAMGVHDITPEMVENCPDISTDPEPLEIIKRGDMLVAHNLKFDLSVLEAEVLNGPYDGPTLDTLRLARHVFPELEFNEDYKLATLRYRCNLPVLESGAAHSAAFDANLCLELALYVYREKKMDDWFKLCELADSAILVKYMPLGKHKGTTIEEMVMSHPGTELFNYIEWIRKQSWLHDERPELEQTIDHWLMKKAQMRR